jgi:uncharacterized membrane protein YeaQ/YmgE (transglycosylase-associated protein family)
MLGYFLLIAIGLMVGGMANSFTHGGRLGLTGNLSVGIVGSFLGGFLFQQFGTRLMSETPALLFSFVVALVGAVLLLVIAHKVKG